MATSSSDEKLEDLQRDFQLMENALKNERELSNCLENIEDEIKRLFQSSFGMKVQMHYFLDSMLPSYVHILLKRSDLDEDTALRVNQFFQTVLQVVVEFITYDVMGLAEALNRIFGGNFIFYNRYGIDFQSIDEDLSIYPGSKEEEEEIVIENPTMRVSTYLVSNIKYFSGRNGFQSILSRIKNKDPRIPIPILRLYIKAISKVKEFLSMDFIQQFGEDLFHASSEVILGLSDDELKSEDKRHVSDIISLLSGFMHLHVSNANELTEKLYLQFALKCFKSSSLEKRLGGLNDIKEFINNALRKKSWLSSQSNDTEDMEPCFITQWVDSTYLVNWIKENQIIEQLYGENLHGELLKRCLDIPKFLSVEGELDRKYLDIIWDAASEKHESISYIIYQTVGELSPTLSLVDLDYIFEKIQQIPYSEYNNQTIFLVRTFSIAAINANIQEKDKKWYGLDVFWDLIQEETNTSYDIAYQAHNFLFEFLQWNMCYSQRIPFMEKCINNLSNVKSVSPSLKMLSRIISTYPDPNMTETEENFVFIIEWLEKTHNLLELFFKEFLHYKNIAKETASKLPENTDLNNTVLCGKTSHLFQIRDRLDFLEFILSHSNLMLSIPQIDMLWSILIVDPITKEESDMAFSWLENSRNSSHIYPCFSDESIQYLFVEKVPQLDFGEISSGAFNFFDFFFRYVNWKNNNLMQSDYNHEPTILSFDLIGIDNLWKVALEAKDPEVGKQAISSLINLHKNLSQELKPSIGKQREDFIQKCMSHLGEATKSSQDFNSNSELRTLRCLLMLKSFINEFEKKHGTKHGVGTLIKLKIAVLPSTRFELEIKTTDTIGTLRQMIAEKSNSPPSILRIITAGKELKSDDDTIAQARLSDNQNIHVAKRKQLPEQSQRSAKMSIQKTSPLEVEDESINPTKILSKEEYFDQLFELLNIPEIAQNVWELLMELPTNQKIFRQVYSLQTETQTNWEQLFDPNSPFKLYYALQIVESLLNVDEEDKKETQKLKEKQEWKMKFLNLGGLSHFFNIFLNTNFFDESKGSKGRLCLALLLKIINTFAIVKIENEDILDLGLISKSVDAKQLILKLLGTIWCAAFPNGDTQTLSFALPLDVSSPTQDEILIVTPATDLLFTCCRTEINLFSVMIQASSFVSWLSGILLFCKEPKIRQDLCRNINLLCKATANINTPILPHTFFLTTLLEMLPSVKAETTTCREYFDLLNKLCRDSCEGVGGGDPSKFYDLLKQLILMIKQHPIVEERSLEIVDEVLIGMFDLTITLLNFGPPSFRVEAGTSVKGGLVNHIFWECLFNIPTQDNHGLLAPPKCKTKNARAKAFQLLTELVKECPENFEELSALLLQQNPIDTKRPNWHYLPNALEKSSTGYVGLRNLGATCYMNSLVQQFFMIPPFRYGILQAPIKQGTSEQELQGNILYQLKDMLANLQESEKKYYDTENFCRAYDYEGQPINPTVQMDADEFFNMLFDKLENLMKGTNEEKIFRQFFGGVLCNQIISKECPHVSERDENFFTLSLEVKNKRNILESLDLYVEGDMLVGENKFYCGECNKKVDALKRCCIKTLPDNLIVHAKRFEFDLEQMRRIKVNDYCEFPEVLEMEAYTKEGLERREKGEELLHSPFYQYRLAGILVHTGTADTGHYYSFIRERVPKDGKSPKWYQFNDSDVELFDIKEIPKACYGGFETVSVWDPVQQKHVPRYSSRIYSAYMLFYERVKPVETKDIPQVHPSEEAKLVPKDIFNKIWRDNMEFLNDKHIFDVDYFKFLWNVVSREVPSEEHDTLMIRIQLATRFIFSTLSHAKEKSSLREYSDYLKTLYTRHLPACKWLLETLLDVNTPWLKDILFCCTIPETREIIVRLIVHVIDCVAKHERHLYFEYETDQKMEIEQEHEEEIISSPAGTPKALVIRFVEHLLSMLKEAHHYWHHFAQYFCVFKELAKMTDAEKQYLLSRSVISQFIDFYLGEDSPFALINHKQKRPKMGDKFNSPNLSYMVDFISILTRSCSTGSQTVSPTQLPGTVFQLNEIDKESLYCEPFYQKILKDNINPKAVAEISVHLSWQDELFSKMILNVCLEGIDRVDHDHFKPYFTVFSAVLGIEDSLQQKRIDFALSNYLQVIRSNMKYRNATYYSIKYLLDVIPSNVLVREWLYEHKDEWIEPWFMANMNEFIRDVSCSLIQSLAPEFPSLPQREENIPVISEESLSSETIERVHEIYEFLLDLLPKCIKYWRFEIEPGKSSADYDIGIWRLVGYFRLLSWYAFGKTEKLMFLEHFSDLFHLFAQADNFHLVCDENKKELMNFWYHVTVDCPENLNLILSNDKVFSRLLDHWISINPSFRFRQYNANALVPFYLLLLSCASNSVPHLEKLMFHTNFEWAINHIYLDIHYENVASVIFKILKLCCEYPQFRLKFISFLVNSGKLTTAKKNSVLFLESLLKSVEDRILFCKEGGLPQLNAIFEKRHDREFEEESLNLYLVHLLEVLHRALSWMVDTPHKELRDSILEGWDPKRRMNLLSIIIQFSKQYALQEKVATLCYDILLVLSALEPICLNTTLQYMYNAYFVNQAQSESLVKTEVFLEFAHKICEMSLDREDKQFDIAVDFAVLLTRETLHPKQLELLKKIWNNPQHPTGTALRNNKNLLNLVTTILITPFLDDRKPFDEFVKPILVSMPFTARKILYSVINDKVRKNMELLAKSTDDKMVTEHYINLLIYHLQTVLMVITTVEDSQYKMEFSQANSKEFSAIIELLEKMEPLKKKEELFSMIKHFVQ